MRRVLALLTVLATAPAAAQLVSAEPRSDAPGRARVFHIAYRSVDGLGRPGVLTGLALVPDAPAPPGGRPVLLWTHGTTGIAEGCAPSGAAIRYTQVPALAEMLGRGWLVVLPDYAGLGSPGPHPYLVADLTARAALDSVVAARALPGAAAGTRVVVWGLSQGGHAALAVGALAPRYAPALELVGVAAAAPPTDLAANFGIRGKALSKGVLTAFVGASWARVYGAPLSTLGRPATVRLIERMARVCALGQGAKLGTVVGALSLGRALRRVDVPATPPWGALLRRNSVAPGSVAAPLLIAQSEADTVVGPEVTRAFARASCREGARLRWLPLAGVAHGQTAETSATATLDWIADRFAGRPAPSDCSRL